MKKRILMLLLALTVLVGAFTLTASAAETEIPSHGTCVESLTWELTINGNLPNTTSHFNTAQIPSEETTPSDPTEPDTTSSIPVNTFTDVPAGAYFSDAVLWAVEKGVTTGMSETSFAPDSTCTRAQIVTFLWRANSSPTPASSSNPFTDVPAGQWYTDAVLWAVEKGITTGTSATTFSPDAGCTRGQVATFLWRVEGEPASGGENIFSDLGVGAYYYDAVLWAVGNSITNGMGDGTFAPDATCTRGQIVTFLYRAADIDPDDGETDEDETLEHTHKYTETVTKPTCTTDGYTTHKCSCGDSYVDTTVAATGHAWGDWKVVKEATATSDGSKERTCSTCNTKETGTIPNLSHTHSYTSVVTKPTCTADGYTTYTCACGDAYTGNKVASTGHSYTHTVTKPTCTADGYTTHTCNGCGDSYVDSATSATGHDWGDWVTIIQPTETSDGYAVRDCKTCGAKENKTIDKQGPHEHSWEMIPGISETRHIAVCPHCDVFLCYLDDGSDPNACLMAHIDATDGLFWNHSWANSIETTVIRPTKWVCACGAERVLDD